MKAKLFTLVLVLVVMTAGLSYGQALSLESTTGLWRTSSDSIDAASANVVFSFRITNDASNHTGITNGFRVYSPDGATWTTTVGDTANIGLAGWFDLVFAINPFDTDGAGSDTVGFGGAALFGGGIPASTDLVAYTLTIGPFNPADHGKSICVDSSFYQPTGVWKWAGPEVIPSWDGPHCFTIIDEATDVVDDGNGLPNSFSLSQNYPNPFNPTTNISFDLPKKSDVTLTIYNVTGQKVTEISDSYDAGSHTITWDASNNASGIYFYKLNAGDFTDTKKMMLIK